MKFKFRIIYLSAIFGISSLKATVINVPRDKPNIQTAINASSNGDTVLVAPGRYFENINFKGKNIVVTSNYIKTGSLPDIANTIIDAGKPFDPDTASCAVFCSGEDSTAVLEGFTLTNGTATRCLYPAGWFREGGGIFINSSAPTIKFNLIIDNEAVNTVNVINAGGGGLRSHLGNPHVLNNVFMFNKGTFGGGAIALDNSEGIFKNNIFYMNTAGSAYGGGGGLWIYGGACSITIENNTIVENTGGGIYLESVNAHVINNIVWGNSIFQINSKSTILNSNNNTIQFTKSSENMSCFPVFEDTMLFLQSNSQLIDAGSEDISYNDKEDSINPGFALLPSMGTIRNDIGAYGGRGAFFLPSFEFLNISANKLNFGNNDTIGIAVIKKLILTNQSTKKVTIDSIRISANSQVKIKSFSTTVIDPLQTDTIEVEWIPQTSNTYKDSLLIYHNIHTIGPVIAYISGTAKKFSDLQEIADLNSVKVYPNPVIETLNVTTEYAGDGFISNLNGQIIISCSFQKGINSFDMKGLPKGIYFIYIFSDKHTLHQKILKE